MDTHQYKEIGRPFLVPAKEVQCLLVLLDRGFQGPSFHGGQSHAGGSFHPGTPMPVIRGMTGYHCITPPREQHIVYCSVSLNYLSDRANSLAVLSRMHRIDGEVPVTAHAGYRLTDPSLRFRFVYPRRTERGGARLHQGRDRALLRRDVRATLSRPRSQGSPVLRLLVLATGTVVVEIDLVGLNEASGDALFCECEWSVLNRRQARGILAALREKAREVRWQNESRNERFALVAKSIEGKEDLREDGYLVCDLEDIARLSRATGWVLTRVGRSLIWRISPGFRGRTWLEQAGERGDLSRRKPRLKRSHPELEISGRSLSTLRCETRTKASGSTARCERRGYRR